MPIKDLKLNDGVLISNLRDKITRLFFLSDATRKLITEAANQIAPKKKKEKKGTSAIRDGLASLNERTITALWKELLVDSIHFLKVCDSRERACWSDGHKTKIVDIPENDKKRRLNAFGVPDLAEYFKQFTEFEAVLYGTDSGYRDHMVHPLRVWLIGTAILFEYIDSITFDNLGVFGSEMDYPFDTGKVASQQTTSKLLISRGELWAMWTIVALCHDLGYPLEKSERINDVLEKMLRYFGKLTIQRFQFNFQVQHSHLIGILLRLVSSKVICCSELAKDGNKSEGWRTAVQEKYWAKFGHSWENFDHGFVSCIIILRTLTYFLETDYSTDALTRLESEDARQFFIRREILRAIAAHTTEKVYHVSVTTLSFLLMLCDELQEWGRPTMADLKKGSMQSGAKEVNLSLEFIKGGKSKIAARIKYDNNSLSDDKVVESVQRKFRMFHELLRPAVYDEKRSFEFEWDVVPNDKPYQFRFSSDAKPLDELKTQKGFGESFDLYPD